MYVQKYEILVRLISTIIQMVQTYVSEILTMLLSIISTIHEICYRRNLHRLILTNLLRGLLVYNDVHTV